MPELPEVEVVRAGLSPAVSGALVRGVDVLDERALTRHGGDAASFVGELEGTRLVGTLRRGKFLWIPLDGTPRALIAHLGMSGQMLLRAADAPLERHERVRIRLEHPQHGDVDVVFADQRTFGSLAVDDLLPTADGAAAGFGAESALLPSQVTHIGRDALDPAFDVRGYVAAVRRRASGVKRILLDQNLMSGVGNIYADEALWAARIHPETEGRALSAVAVRRLYDEVVFVLQKALAEGGTSFDAQYVNVNGEAGYFAHSLNAYGRTAQPCSRCGTPITRASFMNRSSHFCPCCQRRLG